MGTSSFSQPPEPDTMRSAPERELNVPAGVADALVALCMLAFAVALWLGAGAFAPGPWKAQNAGAFPRGISLLLGMCSLLLLARAVSARRGAGAQPSVAFRRPRAVAVAMALAIVYPPLIDGIGYYMATGLWLPVLLWVAGCRKPVGVVLASVGFLVFSRIVFQHLLGTPMP